MQSRAGGLTAVSPAFCLVCGTGGGQLHCTAELWSNKQPAA